MSIEKRTWVYEMLVRGQHDGSFNAAVTLATAAVDTETGEIIGQPTLEQGELASDQVAKVLGAAFVDKNAQHEALKAEIAEQTALANSFKLEAESFSAQMSAQRAELELQGQTIAVLQSAAIEKNEKIAALKAAGEIQAGTILALQKAAAPVSE